MRKHPMTRRGVWLLLAAVLLSGCTALKTPGRPLAKPANAQGYGPILFIPLGGVDANYIKSYATYFKDKLGLDITIIEPRSSILGGQTSFDTKRNQLKAVKVIEEIIPLTSSTMYAGNLPVDNLAKYRVIVAITNQDLYDDHKPELNFVFAQAAETRRGYRIGVVSLKRLDPAFYKQRHQSKVVRERLQKLLTKQIGRLYYGLPGSTDPSSVMYDGINSIADVDRMGEGF